MTKRIFTFLLVALTMLTSAQTNEPEMADAMRANGKIYIVITVIGMIFLALVVFLVLIDRKLKKLEDKINEGK